VVLEKGPISIVSIGPLLDVHLDRAGPLGAQLERRLRELIGSGGLPVGSRLPATRALARDLGVSRGVVVEVYAQLAAEGYLATRRGSASIVAAHPGVPEPLEVEPDVQIAAARWNLRPDLPDLALFPRTQWLSANRSVLRQAVNTDLAYGEPLGAAALRHRLAPLLARTRGVAAHPDRTAVFAGSTQALLVVASVLRDRGATSIALEDPGHRWRTRALVSSGLDVVPVPVDREGLRVDDIPDGIDAVVVSPDHQFPTGVALSPGRRRALADWAVSGGRIVLEHDYDGHLRYGASHTGALQALAPEHVVYVGGASALLAPTIRLGWAVLPARLVVPVANRLFATVLASPRLSQLALAELIERGQLDRHLRRVRTIYRRRREAAVRRLERRLPSARIEGSPSGLFVHLSLPEGTDERSLLTSARARGIAVDGVGEHALLPQPPGLAIGFAALPEPTLERALDTLADAAGDGEVARAREWRESMQPDVRDNTQLRRYELWLGDRLAGHISYVRSDRVIALTHTEVEPDLHEHAGEVLVRRALDDVRRRGARVKPLCPFVADYMVRHPETRELLAR